MLCGDGAFSFWQALQVFGVPRNSADVYLGLPLQLIKMQSLVLRVAALELAKSDEPFVFSWIAVDGNSLHERSTWSHFVN